MKLDEVCEWIVMNDESAVEADRAELAELATVRLVATELGLIPEQVADRILALRPDILDDF